MATLVTLGDSILDCGHYNRHGVHPGGLLVRNDDALFPEFRGRDLASRGPARLVHRAVDGATVASLPAQVRGLPAEGDAIVLLTLGGNDLLGGLVAAGPAAIARFRDLLEASLDALPPRWPILVGNVYDPTFGDDAQNFLGIEPGLARANLRRMNETLAAIGEARGAAVDIHGHFLEKGDASWFTQVIEPSLVGASEVRRCFLPHVERLAARGLSA